MRQDLIDVYQQLGNDFNLPILLSRTLVSYTGQDASAFKIPDKENNTNLGNSEKEKNEDSQYHDL